MRRIALTILALAVGALALARGAPAGAGGGCHSNVFTDEAKTTVELSKSCFSPTVVRVQTGDQVTWTNTDPTAHAVTGVADSWGTDQQIAEGNRFRTSSTRRAYSPTSATCTRAWRAR